MMQDEVSRKLDRPQSGVSKTIFLARELAKMYVDGISEVAEGKSRHLASGFPSLDESFGPWLHEGHLIIVAGRPGMGKSAFAQQIAEVVAENGRSVVLFTLEMGAYEIVERSVARRSGVPVPYLKSAHCLSDGDWGRVGDALTKFAALPFLIDDGTYEVKAMVGRLRSVPGFLEKEGLPPLGLVVVDYIQLVRGRAVNRTLEVGQVTTALKRLAKELSVSVIALSQLNRAVEARTDRRPQMSDLRDSGQVEQDADAIIFLYRDDYYEADSTDAGVAEVRMAKNRHGSTGMVKLAFIGERLMFGELTYD